MPTALPNTTDWNGASATEAGFKTAQSQLRDFLAGLFGTDGERTTAMSTLGTLLSGYSEKTANYTVVEADRGKLIDCTGTFTLSLTAVATLGFFAFAVKNSGSGTVTIDPSGAETIDGAATLALGPGESCFCICTSAAWKTLGRTSNSSSIRFFGTTAGGALVIPDGVTSIYLTAKAGAAGGGGCGNDTTGGDAGPGLSGGNTVLSGAISLTLAGGVGAASNPVLGTYTPGGSNIGSAGTQGLGGTGGRSTNFKGGDGADGAGVTRKRYTVTPGTTINISIGAGGQGGYAHASSGPGGAGGTNTDVAGASGSLLAPVFYGGAGGGAGYALIEW